MQFIVLILLSFVCSDIALKINCTYESDTFPTIGPIYSCKAENIEVLTHDVVIEEITGTHMSGKSDIDVNTIWIENSPKLLFMPRGFEKFYKNLTAIEITSSGMIKLSSEDLQPFPKLEAIWFYRNKLTTLSNDVLQYNPLLRHIDFSKNRIRTIQAGILDPVRRPKVVRFHGNVCIDKDVTNYEVDEMKREIAKECSFFSRESLKLEIEDLKKTNARLQEDLSRLRDENLRNIVEKLQSDVKRLAGDLDNLTTFS